MRLKITALLSAAMLMAVSGAALAQEPQGGGSGEHGVGAGPDPRAMHHRGMMPGMMMHRHYHHHHHYYHHMGRRHCRKFSSRCNAGPMTP